MIYTAPHEFFFTKLKLALFGAVFLAFPIIALQIYKFVAPGLYKNERAAFRPYLLWTFLLFITGALVVYFIVMPLAMIFFLSMEQTGGPVEIHLQAKVSEYLSLIMTLILGFGIMFQLPVVLSLLAQAGIVTAQSLRGFRRYAIVAITAVAGVLSPPDPFSMIAMALPTILLYEAGILRVDWVEKQQRAAKAAAERAGGGRVESRRREGLAVSIPEGEADRATTAMPARSLPNVAERRARSSGRNRLYDCRQTHLAQECAGIEDTSSRRDCCAGRADRLSAQSPYSEAVTCRLGVLAMRKAGVRNDACAGMTSERENGRVRHQVDTRERGSVRRGVEEAGARAGRRREVRRPS